ncbi:MAG: TorF family putative porin [Afipia sp.]|nr:TorF family putative porin [Afipia sp.]
MREGRSITASIASLALTLICAFADLATAQTSDSAANSIILGARGGPTVGGPVRSIPFEERAADAFGFSARAGMASDYIYRGVTLTSHKPAVGAAFETTLNKFYAAATVTSVNLPSHPAAELTFGGGLRPALGSIDLDLGWTYFAYPGELPGGGTEYWEFLARGDTKIGDQLRVAGGFAYSPNVSNTGAWSKFAAFGFGVEIPKNTLPPNFTAVLTAGAGYSWFGNQKDEFGGFPLPSYLTWNAGVTLGRGNIRLDLRYYDTNLSKESCFVYTGDPHAMTGGRIDPVTNPEGLTSRWCSASLVAKLWFALN